jgi:hypothetical protein
VEQSQTVIDTAGLGAVGAYKTLSQYRNSAERDGLHRRAVMRS